MVLFDNILLLTSEQFRTVKKFSKKKQMELKQKNLSFKNLYSKNMSTMPPLMSWVEYTVLNSTHDKLTTSFVLKLNSS